MAKKTKIIAAICILLAILTVATVFAIYRRTRTGQPEETPGPETPGPTETPDLGLYTGYDAVVVTKDTPEAVLEELAGYGIEPIMYEKGMQLIGPGGIIPVPKSAAGFSIYLCEGTYSAEMAGFISFSKPYALKITGAAADKTIIAGGSRIRTSNAAAIDISGTPVSPAKGIVIENLTIKGFEYGIRVNCGDNMTLQGLNITENRFIGVQLSNTVNSTIKDSEISLNGDPTGTDTGYGLSLLLGSKDNTVTGVVYKNNANRNAVDFLERGAMDLPEGNSISMEMVYDIERKDVPVTDPFEEAQNAKPSDKAIRFELEDAILDNIGAVVTTNTEKVEKYSGKGFVFLFNTKITLKVNLKEAGRYRVFVAGTSDDGNNKCDIVQVNGGGKYYTSYLGKNKGKWQLSQPGTEYWENDELHPIALVDGFEFKAGENVIEIIANWGYCCYDYIILDPISKGDSQ